MRGGLASGDSDAVKNSETTTMMMREGWGSANLIYRGFIYLKFYP